MDVLIFTAELQQYTIHLFTGLCHILFSSYQHFLSKHIPSEFCNNHKTYIGLKNAVTTGPSLVYFYLTLNEVHTCIQLYFD